MRQEARAQILEHTHQLVQLLRIEAGQIVHTLTDFAMRHPTGSFLITSATMASVGFFIYRHLSPGRFLLRILHRVMSPESFAAVAGTTLLPLQQQPANNTNNPTAAIDSILNAVGLPKLSGVFNTAAAIQTMTFLRGLGRRR